MDTLIATAFAALFAGCWVMEMRSSRKMREGHQDRMLKLQNEHAAALESADRFYGHEVERARNEGWDEGRLYQISISTPKRDKAGRFA